MKKHIFNHLMALVFACSFQTAQAAVLTIDMPGDNLPYTTTVGAFFDANIYIDSVEDFAGFDFSVTYSAAKLQAISLTSGSIFGAAETETFADSILPGTVHFAEAISSESSLEAGLDINAPTLLGSIRFKALNTGVNSLVDFANTPIFSTFSGDSIGGSKQGAFVTINPAAVVPLPASLYMFGSALLGFIGFRKKSNR